ncbi:MAG: acetylxylan esterase [Candidatus Hydrogenedentes bacterium]|nr:acetylxylan esterase [Candidatus Hydrogenedentota bacterium]
MGRCARFLIVISVLFICVFNAWAGAGIADALAQPVLGAETTKSEWSAFLSKRLPPLVTPQSTEAWERQAEQIRRGMIEKIIYRGVPESWYSGPVRVEWVSDIDTGKGYRIRKLRYEGAPGMWVPALLYEPASMTGKVPAVLSVNGHVGDPGKANEEEQVRRIVLAKRGVIALHPEWIAFGELNHPDNKTHNNLACMNLCGVSGMSAFYLAMKRGLDVLAEYPLVDANRIAMTGLSGGGWQTIILSSLEPRIAVTAPNAGYSGIDMRIAYPSDIGDLEQVPPDLLTVADFSHLTALLAPRPALLIYNAADQCCFKADHMAPSVYDPVVPFYRLYGCEDQFRFYVNHDPGTHNYALDNRLQLYAHLSEHFGLGWDNTEPAWDGEIKTFEELVVGIPQSNATLVSIAESFLGALPVTPAPKDDPIELAKWQEDAKTRLRDTIKLLEMSGAVAEKKNESTIEGLKCATFGLKTGEWTAPAVVFEPEGAKVTTVVFGDGGKKSLAETVTRLVESGSRVVAVDLALQGECTFEGGHRYQHTIMIETTGERVLGQNVAQLGSIAQWAREAYNAPVAIHSTGWISGVIALMYGGLHRTELYRLTTEDAPASLKDLVTERISYNDYSPLFCFGLLREFDVPDLAAMCQGVQVNVKRLETRGS